MIELTKESFIEFLSRLSPEHLFDMGRNDPFSQFFTSHGEKFVTVGLGWYSLEEPRLSKIVRDDGMFPLLPLEGCKNLPKWASSVMWNKELSGVDGKFTLSRLLHFYPEFRANSAQTDPGPGPMANAEKK